MLYLTRALVQIIEHSSRVVKLERLHCVRQFSKLWYIQRYIYILHDFTGFLGDAEGWQPFYFKETYQKNWHHQKRHLMSLLFGIWEKKTVFIIWFIIHYHTVLFKEKRYFKIAYQRSFLNVNFIRSHLFLLFFL